MKKNPFLKAEKAVIRKVYGNAAVLNFNAKSKIYNAETGSFSETKTVTSKTVYITNPHEIADAVVDKLNYLKGDLNMEIAYQEVADAVSGVSGRTANTRNGGIDGLSDTLTFDGTIYRIVKITPKNFYAGAPSRLKLQLRAV
jgi:hypothetical protein